jgi:hypothetical protein
MGYTELVLKDIASYPVPRITNEKQKYPREVSQSPGRISEPQVLENKRQKEE